MKKIAPGVYVETGYTLVTVGAVLTGQGWVCIDTPPYPREARHWRAALQEISPAPFCYIIVTDAHRDRVLGNAWFEAPVVAHEAAARQILSLKETFISQVADEMSANDNEFVELASVKLSLPEVSFDQALHLMCDDREITVISKPSATAGNAWVLLPEEKIAFVGDAIVTDRHPSLRDTTSKAWLNALAEIRHGRYASWTMIPGRGSVPRSLDVEPLAEYLRVARRRVNSLRRAGRPRSEISTLVPELLSFFPVRRAERDEVQRRIKVSLEAIYEELGRRDEDKKPESRA